MLKAALGIVFFPFLSVVAFLHGIYWFIKNVLKNSWAVVGIPLACPSILRKYEDSANKGENSAIAICTCAVACAASSLVPFTVSVITIAKGRFEETTWLLKVAFLVGCTNILSALYEGGRAYWNWLTKKKSGQEAPTQMETTPAKPETKQDDGDLNDKFVELLRELENMITDGFTEEAIMRFIEKVTEIFKEDGIRREQYLHLMEMAEKVKKNIETKPAAA